MTDHPARNAGEAESADAQPQISLVDLAVALGEEKKILFGVPLVITIAAIFYSLSLPVLFTARTVVLPPQQQQGSTLGAIASLGAMIGVGGGLGGTAKSQEEMYLGLLRSETLGNAVVARLDLVKKYEARNAEAARLILLGSTKFTSEKGTGFLLIEADNADPAFAAVLANTHVSELHNMLGRIAVTEAQQRRMFLETALGVTKTKLAEAEVTLRSLQGSSGVLSVEALAKGAIQTATELRAQIAQREVRLSSLLSYSTPQNLEVQRNRTEIASLRSQLAKIEEGGGTPASVKGKGMDAVNAFREVKYQEAVMEALVRQFELAKAEEAKDGPLLQQVDVAVPPEKKSKPRRSVIVLSAGFGGLMLGILLAFLRRSWRLAQANPESSAKLRELRRAWSLRR